MSLLLDTHVWLWSQEHSEKLGTHATSRLLDDCSQLYIATISTLEIARLISGGLIELNGSLKSWIYDSMELIQANSIELSHDIAREAYALPGDFHRDPADRILVATARVHKLTLLTADEKILAYAFVESVDARL